MTASPAADWLPFDLDVARREPERIRHVGYPDKTIREIRYDGHDSLTIYWSAGNIGGMNLNRVINVLRLAPAQPAEGECFRSHPHEKMSAACERKTERARVDHAKRVAVLANEWHPTSALPAEGRVVELRPVSMGTVIYLFGQYSEGVWSVSNAGQFFKPLPGLACEWRYPPGERAEATINAAGQVEEKQAHRDANEPVPAAPQRQNLGLWLVLRGRAPWPEPPRVILSSLPVNAYKRHPK